MFSFETSASPESALKLATAGDREAQFGLGLKFSTGQAGGPDYGRAAEWYRKAAEQSHGMAQFNLGVMYTEGHGVARDRTQARSWFSRAAGQGDAGAQHHLGLSYQRACHEIPAQDAGESRIEAYKWFSLAAAQGYKGSAEACELVNLAMSRDEVVEGNQRVASLAPVKPAGTVA